MIRQGVHPRDAVSNDIEVFFKMPLEDLPNCQRAASLVLFPAGTERRPGHARRWTANRQPSGLRIVVGVPRAEGPSRSGPGGASPWCSEWRRPGSNRQPPACKAGALPVELRPPVWSPDRLSVAPVYRSGQQAGSQAGSGGEARCRNAVPPRPAPVGTRGFEPRTSALSELRSNQLSYAPVHTEAGILAHP